MASHPTNGGQASAHSKPAPPPDVSEKAHRTTISWTRAQEIYENDAIVELRVTGCNRGGLLVEDQNIQGFVPISHLLDINPKVAEDERQTLLSSFIGRTLALKIIECCPDRGRVVFSQRSALAADGCRNQLFATLHPGQKALGTVTNITEFGVFVDLGGVEGLIHVSELSWGRVQHPSNVVAVGSEIRTEIIHVDHEHCRVALSLKRLHPNPWETAAQCYSPGQWVEVTITSVVQFGAFACLEKGLDGLIHISEMRLSAGRLPRDVLSEGQRVQARVLHVDAEKQRLGLSLTPEM
jgi:small subunit ribosomal protein S1